MNVFTIINKLKEGFLKEEALRPYTRPPFNAKEWESPVPHDAPSLMEGKKNVLLPPVQPQNQEVRENALLGNEVNQGNPQQEVGYPQQNDNEIPVAFPDGFSGGIKRDRKALKDIMNFMFFYSIILLVNFLAKAL